MHRMIVFDLDGTLAELGRGILPENVRRLRELEDMGYAIAICSGKPTYYLCGFMRQVGLREPILVGENGGTFQFGVDLPPVRYYRYPCDGDTLSQLRLMGRRIDEACGGRVWYQPNELAVTPFPKDEETFDAIQQIIDSLRSQIGGLTVYRHVDSFDITPKNVTKYNGLAYLSELTGTDRRDMIAVGDGVNDVPMFDYADIAVGIGKKLDYPVDLSFDTVSDCLEYLLRNRL